MRLISTADIREKMTWEKAVTALFRGHQGTRPKVQDILLEDGPFSLFGARRHPAGLRCRVESRFNLSSKFVARCSHSDGAFDLCGNR